MIEELPDLLGDLTGFNDLRDCFTKFGDHPVGADPQDTDGAAGNATATLTGTDWHPIWEPHLKQLVPLGNLQAGSWLQTSSGTWVQATTVRKYSDTGKATTSPSKTPTPTMCSRGATPVLVHNCGGGRAYLG